MRKRVTGMLVLFSGLLIIAALGAQAGSMRDHLVTEEVRPLTLIAAAENNISDEPSTVSANSAIYDSGMLSINAWGMDLSIQTFESDRTQSGYLTIIKNSPELNITAGLLTLNHRPISLTSFLRGEDASLKIKVRLKRINHLKIFMIGAPGASIRTTAQTETEEQPLPTVTFSASPESITAGDSCTLSWSTTDADHVSIDQGIGAVDLSGSVVVAPTSDTTYAITAAGPGGSVTDTAVIEVIPSITIQILSPSHNESINRPDVMVRGTFSNSTGAETGILVNGKPAMVYGNQFVINHVPLVQGDNTITAAADDGNGHMQQATISVFGDFPDPHIDLTADIESGSTPLAATVYARGASNTEEIFLFHTGPGTAEFIQTEDNEYRIELTAEGIHYITAEAADATQISADTIAVVVVDAAEIDALLQRKWQDMKNRLGSGDIEGALSHFSEGAKPMFEYNFNLLKDHMAEITAGMKDITLIKIEEDQAQYNLTGEQGGQVFSFHLLFMKNRDGLWRIVNF